MSAYGFTLPDQKDVILFSQDERVFVCDKVFPGHECKTVIERVFDEGEYASHAESQMMPDCSFSLYILQGKDYKLK